MLQQVPSSLCSRPHLYRHNPGTALSQAREAQAEALSSHQWIGWDRRLPQTPCSPLTRVGTARLAATPVLRVRSSVRLTCRRCLLHRPRRLRQNEQARNLISFSINSVRSRWRFAYEIGDGPPVVGHPLSCSPSQMPWFAKHSAQFAGSSAILSISAGLQIVSR